jgi:hypothetical protein
MRYAFWRVFGQSDDGQIYARWPIDLGGVSLRAGDRICPAANLSGFNPHRVKGCDLEAYQRGDELVIQAVYRHARANSRLHFDRRGAPLANRDRG